MRDEVQDACALCMAVAVGVPEGALTSTIVFAAALVVLLSRLAPAFQFIKNAATKPPEPKEGP